MVATLILNEGQPYSIEIASPTQVETFVLWFPQGWSDEICQTMTKSAKTLLDTQPNEQRSSASFFERYTPHDDQVSPKMQLLALLTKASDRCRTAGSRKNCAICSRP